jgi:hypothetical protein
MIALLNKGNGGYEEQWAARQMVLRYLRFLLFTCIRQPGMTSRHEQNMMCNSKTRKHFCCQVVFKAALVVVAVSLGLPVSRAQEAARRPNVLFFAVDDLRTDLGCYGHPEAKTQNIDALAKRGMVFKRAYCQQAVCSPSRTSLLTGLRPDSTKVYDLVTHFRDTVPDVIRVLHRRDGKDLSRRL